MKNFLSIGANFIKKCQPMFLFLIDIYLLTPSYLTAVIAMKIVQRK
jgi:hypothetical protein